MPSHVSMRSRLSCISRRIANIPRIDLHARIMGRITHGPLVDQICTLLTSARHNWAPLNRAWARARQMSSFDDLLAPIMLTIPALARTLARTEVTMAVQMMDRGADELIKVRMGALLFGAVFAGREEPEGHLAPSRRVHYLGLPRCWDCTPHTPADRPP